MADTKDTKPKKNKKDATEIRFTISQNDGLLKGMMEKVPSGCYTDFTKAALRYYLKAIRDCEVESDFLTSQELKEFKVGLKTKMQIEDVVKIIQACSTIQQPSGTGIVSSVAPVIDTDTTNDIEDEIEYDIDVHIDENNDNNVEVKDETKLNTNTFTF